MSARGERRRAWILSIIAVICTCIACISMAIALATDQWQATSVDRDGLRKIIPYKPALQQLMSANALYFDRTRGLFLWCSRALTVQRISSKEVCVEDLAFNDGAVLDFSHVNSTEESEDLVETIALRNKLVISMVSILAGAIGCSLMTCLVGIGAVFRDVTALLTAGMLISFLTTICGGAAMAIFHGIDYLENTQLPVYIFPAALRQNAAYNELRTHTNIQLGYSYALGWVGVATSTVAALLFLQARLHTKELESIHRAQTITSSSTSLFRDPPKFQPKSNNEFGSKESVRNNAYDMMETVPSREESELGGSRTPTTPGSDDWSPFNELPPDDPINTQ